MVLYTHDLCIFVSDSLKEEHNSTVAPLKIQVDSRWLNMVYFSNNYVPIIKYESTTKNLIDHQLIQY